MRFLFIEVDASIKLNLRKVLSHYYVLLYSRNNYINYCVQDINKVRQLKPIYLHALRLVYGKTGGAEFPAANVARDRLGAPFRRRGRRLDLPARVLGRRILRSDLLVRSVSVPVAAKVQRHRLLDRLGHRRHRGLRLRRRRCRCRRQDVLDLGLTALRMTVKSLRLIRTSAGLAGLRGAPRR